MKTKDKLIIGLGIVVLLLSSLLIFQYYNSKDAVTIRACALNMEAYYSHKLLLLDYKDYRTTLYDSGFENKCEEKFGNG